MIFKIFKNRKFKKKKLFCVIINEKNFIFLLILN